MTLIEKIVRCLTDQQITARLTELSHSFDEWYMVGYSRDHPELRKDRVIQDALRNEYRRRTGEII